MAWSLHPEGKDKPRSPILRSDYHRLKSELTLPSHPHRSRPFAASALVSQPLVAWPLPSGLVFFLSPPAARAPGTAPGFPPCKCIHPHPVPSYAPHPSAGDVLPQVPVPLPKPQPGFHSPGNLSPESREDPLGSSSSSRSAPSWLIEAWLPEGRVEPLLSAVLPGRAGVGFCN